MPTRVIDVEALGSYRGLRLCLHSEVPIGARYVALSHCWGAGSPLKLLKANLSALRQQIDPSTLPRTFVDAVEVTRRLASHFKTRYLWIDSLCIVQDSDNGRLEDGGTENGLGVQKCCMYNSSRLRH